MAKNPPNERCMYCGQTIEFEAMYCGQTIEFEAMPPWTDSPLVFGPTDWQPLPHTCPPGAVEAWFDRFFPKRERFMEDSG
jgi:hypothetical protein